jgi:hypothetical protein
MNPAQLVSAGQTQIAQAAANLAAAKQAIVAAAAGYDPSTDPGPGPSCLAQVAGLVPSLLGVVDDACNGATMAAQGADAAATSAQCASGIELAGQSQTWLASICGIGCGQADAVGGGRVGLLNAGDAWCLDPSFVECVSRVVDAATQAGAFAAAALAACDVRPIDRRVPRSLPPGPRSRVRGGPRAGVGSLGAPEPEPSTLGRGGGGGGGGGRGGGGGHGGGAHAYVHPHGSPGGGHPHAPPAGGHHGPPGRHRPTRPPRFRGGPGIFVWFDGGWWTWGDGGTWTTVAGDLCGRWSAPIDPSPELRAYAVAELAASGGEPVTERWTDGNLYLFTAEEAADVGQLVATVRVCLDADAGTLGAIMPPPPPQPVVVRPHPGGMEGVRRSTAEVARRIARDGQRWEVIEWAHGAVAAANLPDARGPAEPRRIVRALFERLKRETVFHRDPVNSEMMGGAIEILCLDPNRACLRGGDCDDMLIALGAASLAEGVPVRLAVKRYQGQKQAHIVMEYDAAKRGESRWECIDPSTETGECSTLPAIESFTFPVDVEPNFIGIGDPPSSPAAEIGDLGAAPATTTSTTTTATLVAPVMGPYNVMVGSTLTISPPDTSSAVTSATPANNDVTVSTSAAGAVVVTGASPGAATVTIAWTDATGAAQTTSVSLTVFAASTSSPTSASSTSGTLDANETAGWIGIVQAVAQYLTSSAARLRTNAAAFAAVRADLGYPVNDPAPTGESAPPATLTPTAYYIQSHTWTTDAAAAEQRLLATADFLVTALNDAASGARALYFNQGDLFVAANPGDPYRVLMAPNAAGVSVPTYFDNNNQASGQIGILPIIIIGVAVAVVAISAAYAIGRYCDELASEHEDDAMTKVASEQTALVASGAQTPAQAQAQVAALTDLRKGMVPPPAPSLGSSFSWIEPVAIAVSAVLALNTVAGLVGGLTSKRAAA